MSNASFINFFNLKNCLQTSRSLVNFLVESLYKYFLIWTQIYVAQILNRFYNSLIIPNK